MEDAGGFLMRFHQVISGLKVARGITHGRRAFTGPVQVNFNITNRCNIRCVHCYFYSPHIVKPNMIELRKSRLLNQAEPDLQYLRDLQKLEADREKTLSIIERLGSMGTYRFQFGGNGEPFSHSHIMDFLAAAKDQGGFCVVNTNGTLLSPTKIDRLIGLEVDHLRITTMAGKADSYVMTHPGCKESVFEKITENLLYLAERKRCLKKKKPKITMVCVIIGPNSDKLYEFAQFAGKVKAESVVFHLFNDVDDPQFAALIPNMKQTETAKKQLAESKRYLDMSGINHNISNALRVFHRQLETGGLYQIIPCYLGWLAVRLDLDGSVYPCCRCYGSLGNAYEQDFMEIWNSDLYSQWRETAYKINLNQRPLNGCACNTCVHHNLNTRVFRLFHPIKGRSLEFKKLCPVTCGQTD